jgi:CheY-like chemotaxis protein
MSIGLPGEASPLEFPPSPGSAAILVVDEDPAFQLGLKTFLREYVGFSEVFTARNGQEALELIENEDSIELVTLDYQMPGMNGIEVMEELSRSTPRPLSVTMITGYPSEELEDEFRSFASSRLLTEYFLSKPVAFEKLEPLMLRAHEDLEAAKRALEAEALTPAPEGGLPAETAPDSVEEQLQRQGEKLEQIEKKIDALRKRWRMDFWKLVVIGGVIWAALHFGWLKKLEPVWENVKTNVSALVKPASMNDSAEPIEEPEPEGAQTPAENPAPEAPSAEEAPPVSGGEAENSGRPL